MQGFAKIAYPDPLFGYLPLEPGADRMRRERSPTPPPSIDCRKSWKLSSRIKNGRRGGHCARFPTSRLRTSTVFESGGN